MEKKELILRMTRCLIMKDYYFKKQSVEEEVAMFRHLSPYFYTSTHLYSASIAICVSKFLLPSSFVGNLRRGQVLILKTA